MTVPSLDQTRRRGAVRDAGAWRELPALAHHGWSGYLDYDFELTGVVEEIDLGQPHGHLMVHAEGGMWDVVLGPPFRNQRAGITDGVIEIGDTVTASGHRTAIRTVSR